MEVTLKLPDELVLKIVTGIMENFPEASAGNSLRCVGWRYKDLRFVFNDIDADDAAKGNHTLTKDTLLAAFPLVFTDKWPKGCTQPPNKSDWESWEEWLCQSDATDFDAFVQLAIFKEVIYG
jgi:hypothetical protein